MMKQNIATTHEQSKRLIACGVSYKTADMTLSCDNGYYELMATPFHYGCLDEKDAPAWSLSRLLSLLPNRILVDDAWYECQICLCPFGYEVRYHSEVFKDPFGCICENPIEGCVNAIEYLTQNGYKLNEIER